MATKKIISEEDFLKIKNLYLKEKKTAKQIAEILPYSYTYITNVLEENNVYINTKYINKDGFKKGDLTKEVNKLKDELLRKEIVFKSEAIEEKNDSLIAVCKKTGQKFRDYKNSSGALTNHIKEQYPNIVHPSNFFKREIKRKTGKYWHEQFFDIIIEEQEKRETKKCKYCDWSTVDLDNKSGWYTVHLQKEHNKSIDDYVEEFPDEEVIFKGYFHNKQLEGLRASNPKNFVTCKICGKKLGYINDKHMATHKMTVLDYKMMFPNESYLSDNYSEHLKAKYNIALKFCEHKFTSKPQIEINDFLTGLDVEIDVNNKRLLGGVEIDIVIHNKKIGIEFNGNMYHSEIFGKKTMNFHLNKTVLMNKINYSLIHITEDEWGLKKELVKNKLKHILGINNSAKIYARNCKIEIVDKTLKNEFLNKNHIQGEDRSEIHLGAYYNNVLVALMTFDSNRQMTAKEKINNHYELKRFCVDNDLQVIGIAGKLLSYFIKNYNPEKIISFADRRWTLNKDENLYIKLGFKLTDILAPDYTYYCPKIHRYKRFHKFSFGKSSLKKKYPNIYSDDKTEWQMMQELGFDRIWDCGKFKYELDFS